MLPALSGLEERGGTGTPRGGAGRALRGVPRRPAPRPPPAPPAASAAARRGSAFPAQSVSPALLGEWGPLGRG